MAVYWEKWEDVRKVQRKLILGGVGYFGIAAIVSASVMNKDQDLIATSTCGKVCRILQPIGKLLLSLKY